MTRRRRAVDAALAALAFLVLAQGYRLVTGEGPGVPLLLGAAVVVGAAGATLAGAFERLLRKRRV
ncbi:MAG: hypothetical protein ABEJ68_03170 [Halobacteriaceae archaeon]